MNHLYIHIPFCSQKCDYCAFYSEISPSRELIDKFLLVLEKEFSTKSKMCLTLKTIYIGGGTPSLLNIIQLTQLFTLIRKYFTFASNIEISIECNPDTLNKEKIETIATFANRVSLGIQSFNCEFRKTIGRRGNIDNIEQIAQWLLESGIENIGCDLIYAIPNESLCDWELDLKRVLELPIKHISTYSLTYEEGTQLFNNSHHLIDNFNDEIHADNEAEMWEYSNSYLKKNKFKRYEISNFAEVGFECKHNSSIWHGDSYLGCGPAAVSFDGVDRWTNPDTISDWFDGVKPTIDKISKERRAREIFVMGLRTSQGWHEELFKKVTGYDFNPTSGFNGPPLPIVAERFLIQWYNELSILLSNDLLIYENHTISCTKTGFLLWNEIAERLI